MSERTDSIDEDPSQSIPSDPSSTPDPNDIEPQDDQASEKSLSPLEDYRSSSQETHIGVPTLEAITAINEQANGDNDGNSFDEIEDEDEDEAENENENENQDGAGGEYNAHAGPSYWDLSALIWYDDSYDDYGSGNGTDYEGGQDQEDYQEEHQDESQEQEDNNDNREDEEDKDEDEEDEDEEDEEDENETLIESTRPEVGSPERLAPGNPIPSPNQPPRSTVDQQLPPYDMDTRSYLRVPPYPSDTNARLPPPGYLPPPRHLPPELQGYELPPTHGLPRVQGLGQMGESLLNQPLYDNETYYGAETSETFDEEEWPAQASDALYDPYQDQGQSRIRRYSDGAPVFSPLPPPEIPLPPLPANESFLGHGPERQYADQDQDQDQQQQQQQQQDQGQDQDQQQQQQQGQNQDQDQNPNGLPQSDQFLNNLLQQPHGQQHHPEQNQQPGQSRRSASTEYDGNGITIGGGSGRQPYPDLVLPSVEGPNDQHGVGGTQGNPISLSSGDSGNPTNNGSRPETAITISTGSSAGGCRPDASTISTGSSESGGAGPAPATGDGTSGQGHDGEANQDNQSPPEGSTTGQDQDEGSDPAPANDQNDREAASTGGNQGESGHVSPLAQVSPVYRTSSSGIDEATLDELAARGDHYFDSDSQEQQQQQQQEQSRPYDPTSPTYANYPYSPTQPMIPNTIQESGQATEPNTQENYGHGPEDYYGQHVEEDPQQPSQRTPGEQALYENLIDENRLDAPIALARDIVDVMREIIKSTSNSRHSSSRYSSPVITPTRERFAPSIPAPISFSTHYHRFFEPEPGSEVEQAAPTSYFPGPLRAYTYVPSAPGSPGVGSGGEDEAEVGPPPVPVHTPVSVPSIIEPGRFSTPEIDTESEPERLPSTPTPIPRPVLLRQLGIRASPSVRSPRSTTPASERGINIRPDEAAEEREAEREREPEAESEQPADEDEFEPEPKSESRSDTEPTQDEITQAKRDSESAQVKSESGSDIALETIPEYESAPESQPSTRAPSDAGSEYKPGPEQDTDSDSETELGNNQQLVADLEQDELEDTGREQAQEKELDTNPESGKQSENDSEEAEYHSARESAPSPSPHPPPPPPLSPSPPPRRITRAYARRLQQGQQPATQTSTAAEQATEQGPSKTKKEKGKAKARELTPSPPPRGIKRKESSSPSPPPSPPKRRDTRSQTLQQESNKADSGSGKGKGKGKATTSKGTKRRAEYAPETQEPVTKKRKATETEAETEAGSEQSTLKLRSNPKVATRADELRLNNPPTAKRSVYVFGANSHGQLGLGHAEANVTYPTLNTGLTKDTVGVVDIAAGGNHCVALTYDNRVLTWGDNSDGQLGRETQSGEEKTPMEVDFTAVGLPAETVFVQVAATDSATFVLTEFGDVYGWGTFRETYTNEADEEISILIGFRPSVTFQRTPLHIPDLKYVKKLATGAQHVLALTLTEDADLIKSKSRNRRASTDPIPNRITKSKPLSKSNKSKSKTKTKRSTKASATPKPENAVFAWGAYKRDQLGRRILGRQRTAATAGLTPRLVALPGKTRCDIASIGAGPYHSFAVKVDGYVYAWGYNRHGQTGVVDDVNLLEGDSTVSVPTGLEGVGLGLGLGSLEPDREYMLTGGRDYSLAVTDDGRCLSWGSIRGDVLGIRKEMMSEDDLLFDEDSESPSILTKPTSVSGVDSRVEKASAGLGHSILVTQSGTAYAWGSNGEYEVRQPRSDGVELPSAIQTSTLRGLRVVDAAAGRRFSVLLVE